MFKTCKLFVFQKSFKKFWHSESDPFLTNANNPTLRLHLGCLHSWSSSFGQDQKRMTISEGRSVQRSEDGKKSFSRNCPISSHRPQLTHDNTCNVQSVADLSFLSPLTSEQAPEILELFYLTKTNVRLNVQFNLKFNFYSLVL